jgi:peptide/nickel transport system permease protein
LSRLIGRRLLYLLPVLIAVSLMTFLVAALLPGDMASVLLGDQATPETLAGLRHDMGLDRPLIVRYAIWLGHVLEGDFGRSFRTGQTVLAAVAERLPVSLELMIGAELAGLLIGIPVAIICAVRPGDWFDRVMTGGAFAMLSAPAFLIAILLIWLIAVHWELCCRR